MRAMKRASLVFALFAATAACGGGDGASTPDADVSIPAAACPPPSQIVDPTGGRKVGDGTAASCTEAAFDAQLAMGGVIFFDCGPDPVTIVTSAEKPITQNVVIDGGGKVTLDGGGTHRLFSIANSDPMSLQPILTVQRLTFAHGAGPAIDGGGGAITRRGGMLIVNECVFKDNQATQDGLNVGGGAIWTEGKAPTLIIGSVFTGNSASNGGALGTLSNELKIFNSRFEGNKATGKAGNGGNGGALSVDGMGNRLEICGTSLVGNKANSLGGGLYRVAAMDDRTVINRSQLKGNEVADADGSMAGGAYLKGTPVQIFESAVVGNKARGVGGLYLGTGSTLFMVNSTVAENTASNGLGGGLMLDTGVTGEVAQCTIARNKAQGSMSSGGGVAGSAGGLTLTNSIIAANEVGNDANPINCTTPFMDGGGNIQFPLMHGSGSDDPGALCAPGVMKVDPKLGKLTEVVWEGGSDKTWVLVPEMGSPALSGGATGCSVSDQRGKTRPLPCTLGAVEP